MKTVILIAGLALLATPAMADPGKGRALGHNGIGNGPPGLSKAIGNGPRGIGNGRALGHVHAAPLPLAGALPALALVGGALVLARRTRKNQISGQ